jgi:hypothetical protein
MTDLPFLPLAGSGAVAAVRFGPKPRVKGDRRRGHAALRRSVSSLAIICALGAAGCGISQNIPSSACSRIILSQVPSA